MTEPLSSLSKRFNLRVVKDYFPHSKVSAANADYFGPYFEEEAYISFNDSQQQIDEKREFLLTKQNHLFSFKKSMLYYNLLDCEVRLN